MTLANETDGRLLGEVSVVLLVGSIALCVFSAVAAAVVVAAAAADDVDLVLCSVASTSRAGLVAVVGWREMITAPVSGSSSIVRS